MTYTYTDSEVNSGKFYYRLKMVSNSETAYTRIINIEMSANKAFSILPNPAFNFVRLSVSTEKNEQATLLVYNIAGELVYNHNYDLVPGFNTISLQEINRWRAGVYMVRLSSGTINQWQKLIIGR